MHVFRAIVVGAMIGAATLAGGGTAMAEVRPIGPPMPSLCEGHPLLAAWCFINSQSA
ncbi:hypothetical protein ACFWPK_24380 [Nocardia sp. NPDC058519]|uniref:hypothetical protein n=1 Tax=unclassified Nocardia TaxID=2637762 RepID=UPI00365E0E9E